MKEKRLQFISVAQLCPTLCDPMNHSTPGLPVYHQLPELYQLVNFFVSEGQAQCSTKTTNRKNPERSLELQLGDQPTYLLKDQV